ncbi:hypothetical protein H0H93_004763 [Arthromyces matolae]|nr:hypothetical protein H0H93_004763 [Arthromyces matolae]
MTGFSALPIDGPQSNQKLAGRAYVLGPEWAHLPVITVGFLGVQIFWSVEMGYASPYLLSLGLSKSAMSLVFLAGPLSGLFMQPIIGVLADNSTSRFGRRRPFMMIGTVICVLAMLLLGYTRGFASIFTTRGSSSNNALTVVLAILSIYLIDFSINAVMAMDRALVVDTLPPAAQASGNAWAARMLGVGAVIGFFVGTIPLPSMFPFLGTTELEVLSVIVSILLLGGHTLMAVFVKERVLLKNTQQPSGKRPNPFIHEARELWSNLLALPAVIRQIVSVTVALAWIAWFPILFYTTIYIGDLYRRSTPLSPDISEAERDNEATRLGTRALFYSSVLALFLNIVLPAFVATPVTRQRQRADSRASPGSPKSEGEWAWLRIPERMKVNLGTLWAMSQLVLAGCMLGTFPNPNLLDRFTESVTGATVLMSITGFSWAISMWAPFSLVCIPPPRTSFSVANNCHLQLAEAILTTPSTSSNTRDSILLADARTPVDDPEAVGETAVFLHDSDERHSDDFSDNEEDGRGEGDARPAADTAGVLGNHHARLSRLRLDHDGEDADWEDVGDEHGPASAGGAAGGLSAKAGIILGIHNVFVVIPQFLVTGISAVIFAIFDPVRPPTHPLHPSPIIPSANSTISLVSNSTELVVRTVVNELSDLVNRADSSEVAVDDRGGQSNSVVYIFRLGGVSALVAFVLCWRLARELRHR